MIDELEKQKMALLTYAKENEKEHPEESEISFAEAHVYQECITMIKESINKTPESKEWLPETSLVFKKYEPISEFHYHCHQCNKNWGKDEGVEVRKHILKHGRQHLVSFIRKSYWDVRLKDGE